MNLTKTETKIMTELAAKGRFSSTKAWGRGAGGGRVKIGHREYAAAIHLIEMGLAVKTDRFSDVEYRNGWGTHYSTIVIKSAKEHT